jgi:hypothetical protein
MSAKGHQQTFSDVRVRSALPPKADSETDLYYACRSRSAPRASFILGPVADVRGRGATGFRVRSKLPAKSRLRDHFSIAWITFQLARAESHEGAALSFRTVSSRLFSIPFVRFQILWSMFTRKPSAPGVSVSRSVSRLSTSSCHRLMAWSFPVAVPAASRWFAAIRRASSRRCSRDLFRAHQKAARCASVAEGLRPTTISMSPQKRTPSRVRALGCGVCCLT